MICAPAQETIYRCVTVLRDPPGKLDNQRVIRNGIIKDSVILGYNASGKTNLGLAMMDIIVHLTNEKWSRGSGIFYLNLCNHDVVVSFTYTFKFGSYVLEYAYEKNQEHVIRETVKIDGKKVIVNDREICFVNLRGAENLNLNNWDQSISLVRYVYANTILDKEDKDCLVFLEFMNFVNQMVWISSTEGLKSLGVDLSGGNLLGTICRMENGVKDLEAFLRDAGLEFRLVARDKGEGETIYCQMGGKEVLFSPLMSSGTKSLVFLFLWYMRRKYLSFIFIDEFDAFYHTDLSITVIEKLLREEHIQVVFTTHNSDVISNELLRPDCYFILTDNMIQPFCNLTDKALREAHNLQKMYKAGAFYGK